MREEPLPEYTVNSDANRNHSLQYVIDETLMNSVGVKIIPSDTMYSDIESDFPSFVPDVKRVPTTKRFVKVFAQCGEGLYSMIEKKEYIPVIEAFATEQPQFGVFASMRRRDLTNLIAKDKDAWSEAICKHSTFEFLKDNGSFYPDEWRFDSIESRFKYDSKMFYQGRHALTPLSVEPFDLGKLSIILPGSSTKVWRIFPRGEQTRLNDYIKYHREWKCASPLLHRMNFIDDEAVVKLNLQSYTTVQRPGEIVALAPGSCYQAITSGPLLFEEMLFYNSRVAVNSIERIKCKCMPVLNPLIEECHKDIRLFLGSIEMLNFETFNGPRSEDQRLLHLQAKLSSTATTQFRRRVLNSLEENDDTSTNDETTTDQRSPSNINDDDDDVIVLSDSNDNDTTLPKSSRKKNHFKIKIPRVGDTVSELKKRKSDQKYYQNLSPEQKKKRAEKDINRARETTDEAAIFFKREIEKAQKRLGRIFDDLEIHRDANAIHKPKRTIEQLEAQKDVDEAIKTSLIKDREKYNILKQIYCKSKGTLKANFLAGLCSEEVIRLFFDHTSKKNVEIWNLAVGLAIKGDENQKFYKELIKDKDEWEAYFNIRHGFRIPWKEWMEQMQGCDSEAVDDIIECLASDNQSNKASSQISNVGLNHIDIDNSSAATNVVTEQLNEADIARVQDLLSNNESQIEDNLNLSFNSPSRVFSQTQPCIQRQEESEQSYGQLRSQLSHPSLLSHPTQPTQRTQPFYKSQNDGDENDETLPEEYYPTQEEQSYVEESQVSIFFFDAEEHSFTMDDLNTLEDGVNPNHTMTNEYLRLINKRSLESAAGVKCLTGTTDCSDDNYHDIESYKQIGHLETYDFFLAPVFKTRRAYSADMEVGQSALFVIDVKNSKYIFYSAFGNSNVGFEDGIENVKSYAKLIWNYHGIVVEWDKFEDVCKPADLYKDVPSQLSWGDNCLYTMVFAEQISRGEKMLHPFDVPFTRKRIMCEIFDGKLFNQIIRPYKGPSLDMFAPTQSVNEAFDDIL